MSNFSQFMPEERGYNDIKPVAQPVVDNTAAEFRSNMAQGIDAFADTVGKVGGIIKQRNADKALATQQGLEDEYVRGLKSASTMAEQEVGDAKVGAYITGLENRLTKQGMPAESMLDLRKKMEGLSIGRPLVRKSAQEQAMEHETEQAVEAGFIDSTTPPEEQESALAAYRTAFQQEQADKRKKAEIDLKMADVNLSRAERENLSAERSAAAASSLSNITYNARPVVKNKINGVLSKLKAGTIDRKEAEAELQALKGDLTANLARTSSDADPVQYKTMTAPLLELYERTISNLGAETYLNDFQNDMDMVTAKSQRNMLVRDPELQAVVSLSSLFNHNAAVTAKTTEIVAKHLNKNSNKNTPPADLTGGGSDEKVYLEAVGDSLKLLGQVDRAGNPTIEAGEAQANVESILAGASRYIKPGDDPANYLDVLNWVAQPHVGKYIKESMSQLSPEAVEGLSSVLIKSSAEDIYPAVHRAIGETVSPATDSSEFNTTRPTRTYGVTEDELELVSRGNQVVFRALTPNARADAERLNRGPAKALNAYINAMANVSSDSFEQVFNRDLPIIWPSKYREQGQDQQEAVADETDYNSWPNGEFTDSRTGEPFTINNGVRTKGWE